MAEESTAARYSFSALDFSNNASNYNALALTPEGHLWIATSNGLFKHDGFQIEKIEVDTGDSNGRSLNKSIHSLTLDSNNNLWVGCYNGVFVYQLKSNSITSYIHSVSNQGSIPDDSTLSIFKDNEGTIWLGMLRAIAKFDSDKKRFSSFSPWPKNPNSDTNRIAARDIAVNQIVQQAPGIYWLATTQSGLIRFASAKNEAQVYRTFSDEPLYIKSVNSLLKYNQENLLLATNEGLVRFSLVNRSFHRFPENEPISERLTQVVRSPSGDIWTGGTNLYQVTPDLKVVKYDQFKEFGIDEKGVDLGALYIDPEETIYAAFDSKGIYRASPFTSKIKRLSSFQGTDNNVTSLMEDSDKNVWIGFSTGLAKATKQNNGFKYHSFNQSSGHDFNNVSDIHEGINGTVWVAGESKVTSIDTSNRTREYYLPDNLHGSTIQSIVQDYYGNVWVSVSHAGILKLDRDLQVFQPVEAIEEQELSIWSRIWLSISPDRKKLLFIKSTNGYGIIDIKKQEISVVYKTTELKFPYEKVHPLQDASTWLVNQNVLSEPVYSSHNSSHFSVFNWRDYQSESIQTDITNGVIGVIKDKNRRDVFWLTSPDNQIYEWSQKLGTINRYSTLDFKSGITKHAGIMLSDATLIWPSENGVAWLDVAALRKNPYYPKTIISQLKINNELQNLSKSDLVGYDNDGNQFISLSYDQNFLEFGFRNTSFVQPEKNQYSYRLVGAFDKWVKNNQIDRKAVFVNLPPGDYTFEVRSSNNDEVWSRQATKVKILISPPWWRSNLAFVLYLIIICALFYVRELRKKQQTLKLELRVNQRTAELQVSKEYAERLMEEKSQLTENIYHQTRTPIQMLLANMSELKSEKVSISDYVERQSQSIRQLIRLTDSVMLSESNATPSFSSQNIDGVLVQLVERYALLALNRKFKLEWNIAPDLILWIDIRMFEDIVDNLLSNSFKYTKQGSVKLSAYKEGDEVIILCEDTGIGIANSEIDKVIQRNVRGGNARGTEGAGIGLSIVDIFVDKLSGKMQITSELDVGTKAKIAFQAFKNMKRELCEDRFESFQDNTTDTCIKAESVDNEKPQILLVEDNKKLASYYKNILSAEYNVSVTFSAELAIEIAVREIPDIIITDVMMGGLNGYDLVKMLRRNDITNHIPILMLTAKADFKSKLRGYEVGANDYIVKPVKENELVIRVQNQLDLIRSIQQKYNTNHAKIKKVGVSVNDRVLDAYVTYIRENYAEVGVRTADIGEKLFVTKKQLERKIKQCLGVTPNQYLINYRLKNSKQMLSEGHKVKDVYERCGFSSHAYFSKKFKEKYTCSPSEFANKNS